MPGGNPYHDEKGKFTDGPSGGGVATLEGLQKKLESPGFSDGPSSGTKKMLETKHGYVEPLPKGTPKKVKGGFTGYKVMSADGVQVGEVWRNPSGSAANYTAFNPDGTEAGQFAKKVHAIQHLATAAKGKVPPSALKVEAPAIKDLGTPVKGVGTSTLKIADGAAHPPGMVGVVSGHKVFHDGKAVGEVWVAEHKTEKTVKYFPKKNDNTYVSKSHATMESAAKWLVDKNLDLGTPDLPKVTGHLGSDISISPSERSALHSYGTSGSQPINQHLRAEAGTSKSVKHSPSTYASKATVLARIAHIDAVMARSVIGKADLHGSFATTPDGPMLFRGGKVSQFGVKDYGDLKVGMELQNHAYISTSKSMKAAMGFMSGKEGAVLMHIRTGPKSHGIDMNKHGLAVHTSEQEVLLPRKSKFRIYKIEHNVVHVEHIDPH